MNPEDLTLAFQNLNLVIKEAPDMRNLVVEFKTLLGLHGSTHAQADHRRNSAGIERTLAILALLLNKHGV